MRGGFGTFYERLQGNDIYNAATAAPFANYSLSKQRVLQQPRNKLGDGWRGGAPTFAQGSTTLAQTYRAPAVAQFSLGMQHQIALR